MKIERIPATTPPEEFLRDYFEPEVPVIVTGVTQGWPAATTWTLPDLTERFADRPELVRSAWFEMDDSVLGDEYQQPPIVASALHADLSASRPSNVRVWLHRRGNKTALHHDGNLLFVFNVQVKGRKHWRLISPDSQVGYNFLSRVPNWNFHSAPADEIREMGVEVFEFELLEGEMLFIPSLWAHQVVAIDPENVNLNWVATRLAPTPSRRLRREQELLGAIELLSRFRPTEIVINRLIAGSAKSYVDQFGGVGSDLVDRLTEDVTGRAVARRIISELATLPKYLAFGVRRRRSGLASVARADT